MAISWLKVVTGWGEGPESPYTGRTTRRPVSPKKAAEPARRRRRTEDLRKSGCAGNEGSPAHLLGDFDQEVRGVEPGVETRTVPHREVAGVTPVMTEGRCDQTGARGP
jgi:hypothetical protein